MVIFTSHVSNAFFHEGWENEGAYEISLFDYVNLKIEVVVA